MTTTGVGGVIVAADMMAPGELVEYVQRLESLGYDSVWIPDMFGREIYVTAAHLLANTTTIRVGSGIAHVYGRDAIASAQAARTLAELDHPHIVPIYDVGSTDSYPIYIVSKLIQGSDLNAHVHQRRLGFDESAELISAVADALHFAHRVFNTPALAVEAARLPGALVPVPVRPAGVGDRQQ